VRNIPTLYHWAPRAARESIEREGLLPTCPSGVRGGEVVLCVCLARSPLDAWALVKANQRGGGEWDLYQVCVSDTPVQKRKHWGRWTEIRVPRAILPQGVRRVASRVVETESGKNNVLP
jgi:hypothetical protein